MEPFVAEISYYLGYHPTYRGSIALHDDDTIDITPPFGSPTGDTSDDTNTDESIDSIHRSERVRYSFKERSYWLVERQLFDGRTGP